MSTVVLTRAEALHRAAERAVLAPSIHNTQPWKFRIDGTSALEIYADWSRQLSVTDPAGRQLTISCGCALFNARVALAAARFDALIQRYPDPSRPELIARLSLPSDKSDYVPSSGLDLYVPERQSNRRRFEEDTVTATMMHDVVKIVQSERARVYEIRDDEARRRVGQLSREADAEENADPAYQAELRRWTRTDVAGADGVPVTTVPRGGGQHEDAMPVRDFDPHGIGWLPTETGAGSEQCILIVGTPTDDPLAWVHAGEALEHIWLQATRLKYVASVFTQPIEVPRIRSALQTSLNLGMHAQVTLRIGHALSAPHSPRRPLAEMMLSPTASL